MGHEGRSRDHELAANWAAFISRLPEHKIIGQNFGTLRLIFNGHGPSEQLLERAHWWVKEVFPFQISEEEAPI